MKKFLVLFLSLNIVSYCLFSQAPNGYYDDAQGKTGAELKTALYMIIKDHSAVSYSGLWSAFADTDKKSNGKVWDMYSDVPGGTPAYEYTFGSDQCGSYSGEGDCYNREHSFPKSWFNDATPMYSDLFHLVPTDGYVNGRRSNYIFGELSSVSWTSTNGSKLGTCTLGGQSNTAFEPIDAYKGDFARTYLYMVTRYQDRIATWDGYGTEGSKILDGQTYPGYVQWYIDMLMAWHQQDPVDQKEINRNNAIYEYQNNRNPFIDHPEYAGLIWGGEEQWEIDIANITQSPVEVTSSNPVVVNATITSTFPLVSVQLWWGFSESTLQEYAMQANENQYSAQIPAQDENTMVYYRLQATDDQEHTISSSLFSYTVASNNPQLEILNQDFSVCPPAGWNMVSLASNKDWTCNPDDENMEINAYGGNEASEDWLISPALDLSAYISENLSFKTYTQYTDSNHPSLKLYWSNTYTGSGSPILEQWTEINFAVPASNSMAWTNSGVVDLSQITGTQVYLGFRYLSTGTGSNSSSLWKVDDITVLGYENTNHAPLISNVQYSPQYPGNNSEIEITAIVTDLDQNLDSVKLWYGSTLENISQFLEMVLTGENLFRQSVNCGQGPAFYFRVEAMDSTGLAVSSEVVEIIVSGVEETQLKGIQVFPNPAGSKVQIQGTNDMPMRVEIWNLQGMAVEKSSSVDGKLEISLHNLSPAVYILKINSGGQNFYKRLVVE